MLALYFGIPGAGKGLTMVEMIRRDLIETDVKIITTLPIQIEPWIGPRGVVQPGFRHYLSQLVKPGPFKEAQLDSMLRRLRVVSGAVMNEFYSWVLSDSGELLNVPLVTGYDTPQGREGDCGYLVPNMPALAIHGRHHIYVDEAWKHFSSEDWKQRGKYFKWLLRLHRHLGWNMFFFTQAPEKLDNELRTSLCQRYVEIQSNRMNKFRGFKMPTWQKYNEYLEFPDSKRVVVVDSWRRRFDPVGAGGSYNTAAGSGLIGASSSADAGVEQKGLPWWVGLAAVIAAIIFVGVGIVFGSKWAASRVAHLGKPLGSGVASVVSSAAAAVSPSPAPVALPPAPVDVYLTATYRRDGQDYFCLSDGRKLPASVCEFYSVDSVVMDGRVYRFRPLSAPVHSSPSAHSSGSSLSLLGLSSPVSSSDAPAR